MPHLAGAEGAAGIEHHDEGLAFLEMVTKEGVVDLWSLKIGSWGDWRDSEDTLAVHEAWPALILSRRHKAIVVTEGAT